MKKGVTIASTGSLNMLCSVVERLRRKGVKEEYKRSFALRCIS